VMQFIEGTSLEKYVLSHRVEGRIAVLPEDFIVGVLGGCSTVCKRSTAASCCTSISSPRTSSCSLTTCPR